MSERWLSLFLLLGAVLVVLGLWYASVRAVAWDARRREMKPLERKAWLAAAIALPLFGFALYLFVRLLKGYLAPAPGKDALSSGSILYEPEQGFGEDPLFASPSHEGRQVQATYQDLLQQAPIRELSEEKTNSAHSNGKAHMLPTSEIKLASYQSLRARYSLIVVQGPLQGQQFILNTLPVKIGRGVGSDVSLEADLNISREHAEIYELNGVLHIRDLGSMHGTRINESPVVDQELHPGDKITVGATVLILHELP